MSRIETLLNSSPEDYMRANRYAKLFYTGARGYGEEAIKEQKGVPGMDYFARIAEELSTGFEDPDYFYYGIGIGMELIPEQVKKEGIRIRAIDEIAGLVKNKGPKLIAEGREMPVIETRMKWYKEIVGREPLGWLIDNTKFDTPYEIVSTVGGFAYSTASFVHSNIAKTERDRLV